MGEAKPRSWWFRGYRVDAMLRDYMRQVPKTVRKRLRYYRQVAVTAGTRDVLLYGASQWTDHDNDTEWYMDQLMRVELEEAQQSASSPVGSVVVEVDASHDSYDA